ncbi:protein IMPACT isoform X2 [Monodelphis domestica]|uniref:protein IMPACT isoform X2 n=1 Tax=Monodelphis domestica TaxID=13616 RepID=UPI000443605E|nr:protein IMPACT isoform X2 [Monodelphis domestica]
MALAETDCGQRQIDEIEALSSIYGDEWCVIDEATKIFCIKITDNLEKPKWTLCLQVILPSEYPDTAPPIYQLNAPWLKGQDRVELANSLEEIYVQNLGESILYLWVEKIRELLIEKSQQSEPGPDLKKTTEEDVDYEDDYFCDYQSKNTVEVLDFVVTESQSDIEELPPIKHGVPITDRRSTFQAHLAPVVFLKQILNVRNVLVVVSRWYGGILLGPDRFKHINNCARNILVEQNYTNSPEDSSKQLGKNKKVRKDKKKNEHCT